MKRHISAFGIFIIVLSLAFGCDDGNDGVRQLAQDEIDVLDYVNFARTDPQGFAETHLLDSYNNGQDNGAYEDLMAREPVGALTIHQDLQSAAYSHSVDMADNCESMQHDSCDGSSFSDRVSSFYLGNTMAENIAWNYVGGLNVVLAWIIDNGIPSLGHRLNIMNGAYEHMGISHYKAYWTQDFGSGGK
jgi:Cysteine-rich secretory protein family